MSDTSTVIGSIQGWIQSVNGAFASLPEQIDQNSSPSAFADVLTNVQSLLSGGLAAASGSATSGSSLAAEATGQQALLTSALSSGQPSGQTVISHAEQYLGTPYVWGGTSPSGFDCSGFVQYVYGQLGVSLPRTAAEQAQVGTPVDTLADAQTGDLVFFAGSDGTASSPGHVGIYIGNGQMIDAPETGQTVSIQPVGDPVAIRRVDSNPAAVGGVPSATLMDSVSANSSSSSAGVPSNLLPLFQSAASQYGVPLNLLTAVAQTESGFNPNAVSSAGAEGLMQLMPSTAASLGVNPLDPAQAINGAAQLLSGYLATFKSTPLALAAYNAGAGAVEQYGGIPPYPQTQTYVQTIMNEIGTNT